MKRFPVVVYIICLAFVLCIYVADAIRWLRYR